VAVFAEALLIRRLLAFFDIEVKMELFGDASASRGMANRIGVGRVRHLEIKTLWMQQFTMGKRGQESVTDRVIHTSKKGADIGTKAHAESRLRELMQYIGMRNLKVDKDMKEVEEVLLMKDFKGVVNTSDRKGSDIGQIVATDAHAMQLVHKLARCMVGGNHGKGN